MACSPQAWAAGSVFLLLQACLGVEVDGLGGQVRFSHSRLPDFIEELWISDLQVGAGSIDLALQRRTNDLGISVLHKRGAVKVVSVK